MKQLSKLDEAVTNEHSARAQTYLTRARESSNQILSAVHLLRAVRVDREGLKQAGRPNEQEQDLLRAMVVSACAGLDAAIKTLIRDALPELADRSPDVQQRLDEHAQRLLTDAGTVSPRTLARVLSHEVSPRTAIVESLTLELTGGSLQSADQLMSVCASFGIADSDLKKSVLDLKEVFVARNEIIHEMDMSTEPGFWKRRLRSVDPMIRMADRALSVGQEIINKVGIKLDERS
jgi:hypothetical protein